MPRSKHRRKPRWPQILILGGLALLVTAILIFKTSAPAASEAAALPEQQLQHALAESEPTAVFFHSLTCDPCIQMMDVVDQVYPSFSEVVALVDVNVSDTRNHDLLRAEDIRVIPSLVLYDRRGQRQVFYGVMPPDQFRQQLLQLVEQ